MPQSGSALVQGTDSDDTLVGTIADEELIAGLGVDSLIGGKDIYIIDPADSVVENTAEGFDTVILSDPAYTQLGGNFVSQLADNVETFFYDINTSVSGINLGNYGRGNSDNNLIFGGTGNNNISAGGGYLNVFINSLGDDYIWAEYSSGGSVVFTGNFSDYNYSTDPSLTTVTNKVTGEVDNISGLTFAYFADGFIQMGSASFDFKPYNFSSAVNNNVTDLTDGKQDILDIDILDNYDFTQSGYFAFKGDIGDVVRFDDRYLVQADQQVQINGSVYNQYFYGRQILLFEDGLAINPDTLPKFQPTVSTLVGAEGDDTLDIYLTAEQFNNPDIIAEIQGARSYFANNVNVSDVNTNEYIFTEIPLIARIVENIRVFKDGVLQDLGPIINLAPIALDDSFVAIEENLIFGNVLLNDSDPELTNLTVIADTISTVNGGTVTINADRTFTYTAAADYIGTDSFDYTISDILGTTDVGTVNIDVQVRPNRAPEAVDDFIDIAGMGTITGNVVQDNGHNGFGVDFDLDRDNISVIAGNITTIAGASVIIQANGDFTYAPALIL